VAKAANCKFLTVDTDPAKNNQCNNLSSFAELKQATASRKTQNWPIQRHPYAALVPYHAWQQQQSTVLSRRHQVSLLPHEMVCNIAKQTH
jgi:hypothetical protein